MTSDSAESSPSGPPPQAVLDRWEARATLWHTRCGDGRLVWHIWGAGPPLILLHGGAGSWTHWIRTIPACIPSFTVFAPDLPGLGDSDAPPSPYTAESLASILSRGIDELLPGSPFHLCGFSFGGVLAGHVAAEQAGRVATLTIIGAGGLGLPHGEIPRPRKSRPDMPPAELAAVQRHNLGALMFGDPAKIDALALHVQAENVRRARLRERSMAESDTLRRALPRVTASVLAIYGDLDVYAAPYLEARRALLRELQPGGRFQTIEGVGHWVPYEAAERFNELLIGTLSCR